VNAIAEAITKQTIRPIKRKAKWFCRVINHLGMYRNIEAFDKKFTTTSACNGCGLCSEICPVNNITLDNHHPIWHHRCERCMACIEWCPTEAIQYGKKTIAFKRYHNPAINLADITAGNKHTV